MHELTHRKDETTVPTNCMVSYLSIADGIVDIVVQ